jgi:hypothetical protein
MSAQPAHRPEPLSPSGSRRKASLASVPGRPVDRAVVVERRRRAQLVRQRRRDLVTDAAIALALTLLAVVLTAGLGVLALIEVPVALALVGTVLMERRTRKRRRATVR